MSRLVNIRSQWNTSNAKVRPGQKMHTYAAGTTTPAATYTDAALTIPHANPVIADATGTFPEVFLIETGYKLRLTDAKDVQYDEIDGVFGLVDPATFTPGLATDQEVFTATASQDVFTLSSSSYTPGINGILVFVDELHKYSPADYTETSPTSITFTTPLSGGETVVIITSVEVSTGGLTAQQVSYNQQGADAVTRTQRAKNQDFVSVKDFGAACDGDDVLGTGTDDTAAVQAAITYAENAGKALYVPGICLITEELFVRKPLKIFGDGPGYGYGSSDPLTGYEMRSGFLLNGTGVKRIRTRVNYRANAGDAQDNPISVGLNIQHENCQLVDMCVFLYFDRSDSSPTNYGAAWDVGVFNGCRVHMLMENVHIIGYYRQACYWQDVTRNTGLPEFDDPNGTPYEAGSVTNGCDGTVLIKPYFRGGKWAIKLQGAEPKTGETAYVGDYYDELLGGTITDRRGSFGASDFNVYGGSLYGTDHHSDYRRDDITGDNLTDPAGGVMSISGLAGNSSDRIQGFRFVSCRFASWEPFRIRCDFANRPQFYGCHIEPRSGTVFDTAGNPIDSGDYTTPISYGQISATANTSNMMSAGMNVTINKTWFDATAQASLVEYAQASSTVISQFPGTMKVGNYQPISGDLDLRSETTGDDVRFRLGAVTHLALSSTGLAFGSTLVDPIVQSANGELDLRSDASSDVRLRSGSSTLLRLEGSTGTAYHSTTIVRPTVNNTTDQGTNSAAYKDIYTVNAVTVTSDGRVKTVRGEPTEAELRAWGNVRTKIYQLNDSIAEKGADNARYHTGYVAQDVEAAFDAEGLDAGDYGLWVEGKVYETATETKTVSRPKTKMVTKASKEVEVIDGVATLVERASEVEVQITKKLPVYLEDGSPAIDGDGKQMTFDQAVMEDVEVEIEVEVDTGETRYALRYEQCLAMEVAYLRSLIQV